MSELENKVYFDSFGGLVDRSVVQVIVRIATIVLFVVIVVVRKTFHIGVAAVAAEKHAPTLHTLDCLGDVLDGFSEPIFASMFNIHAC